MQTQQFSLGLHHGRTGCSGPEVERATAGVEKNSPKIAESMLEMVIVGAQVITAAGPRQEMRSGKRPGRTKPWPGAAR